MFFEQFKCKIYIFEYKLLAMLFKHPSVLYALFALLIPILIHLFKLRKFQKTAFTNVAFLEKIKIQSRKSSRLKKWLVLFSRLSILTLLILAFAFPYLPSKSTAQQPEQYIIYLDNSFSLQAKGNNGPLLKRAIQDIIENFNDEDTFTLFTNTEVFKDIQLQEAQNEILGIDYSSEQLSPEQIVLKAKKLAKNKSNNAFVFISDFQQRDNFNYDILNSNTNNLIQLLPQKTQNTAIDSLWLTSVENQKILNIATSSSSNNSSALSVLNDKNLIGKANIDFSIKKNQVTQVPLPKNTSIRGTVTINTNDGLLYDDTRFFSVNQLAKSNVLVIGSAFSQFLQKIYTPDEFNFSIATEESYNVEEINKANLIILNEIELFPKALEQRLINFTKQGGILCVIPSIKKNPAINDFLATNYNVLLGKYTKNAKKLTQISYSHPLFRDVFSKESFNFQYPTIKESYQLTSKNWALNLEDNNSFLVQSNSVFVFSTPLNESITNFKNSPLVVPTFYNIAKQNLSLSNISYPIGGSNEYVVKVTPKQDEVLVLKSELEEFIPLQQLYKNYIKISTDDLPKKAGNYQAILNNNGIHNISYNYNAKESKLIYENFTNDDTSKVTNSVSNFFQTAKANFQTTDLWKWFLIFALFCVLIEILLIKLLK